MRQILFGLDLALCSIWLLFVFGSRCCFSFPVLLLTSIVVLARMAFSFAFYRREKRCWIPLSCFIVTIAMHIFLGGDMAISNIVILPFRVFDISSDLLAYRTMRVGLLIWLWFAPVVVYVIAFFRKGLSKNSISWKDALGAILWTDSAARKYCQLMLMTIGALYIGRAMDMRLCLLGCLVLPSLTYCLLAQYYDRKWAGSEEQNGLHADNIFMMIVAMVIFYYAQCLAGIWRIWMLVASLALVAYVCWQTFGKKRLLVMYESSVLYIGVFLPTLTIGNNQYTCIEYGRWGLDPLESYRGIFLVKDSRTDRFGLRDRYGLLVKPEYDKIVYHTPRHLWGTLELRRNGYYTLYDICDNRKLKANDIDHQLQDSICMLLDKHMISNGYDYNELMEVKVKDVGVPNRLMSHVKVLRNGFTSYYDYDDKPYITADSVLIPSGEFTTDSIEYYGHRLYVLHYSCDVKQDSTVLYNIDMKAARLAVPQQEALVELEKEIEMLLR